MPKARVNDIEINYSVDGEGHYLTLVHGAHFDLTTWKPQVAYFSRRYRVVTYDLRGHGQSETPRWSYSIDDCVDDLYQLLDYLGVERSYLVGISMGGNIALNFSLDHADRVDALVIAGTNSSTVREEVKQATVEKRAKVLAMGAKVLLDIYRNMLYSTSFSRQHPDQIANWEKRFLTNSAEGLIKAIDANLSRPDLTSKLSEIYKPTLIVVGDKDVVTPSRISEAMKKQLPNSELKVVPNCGHICNEEQPDSFNSVVAEFLEKVEGVSNGTG